MQLSTLANIKDSLGRMVIHIGMGPELIYVADRRIPKDSYVLPLSTEKYHFGIMGKIGLFTDIDKYRIGISFSYSDNFKTIPDIKNYTLNFCAGYIF